MFAKSHRYSLDIFFITNFESETFHSMIIKFPTPLDVQPLKCFFLVLLFVLLFIIQRVVGN